MSWFDRPLRISMTAAHKLMKLGWFIRRPRTFGAHAVALTSEHKIILVKLRYAPGWRLPGGGRRADESAEEAALRETREEIGMTGHGRVRLGCELEEEVEFKRDLAALVIVEDVNYRPPRWSLEVEAVREFAMDDLPPETSAPTRRWIATLRDRTEG
jgi:ADP-ribose pyrophosphatase YjhB (NUDIX family)